MKKKKQKLEKHKIEGTQSRRFCNVIGHKRVTIVIDCLCFVHKISQKVNIISRELTEGEQFAIVV